MISIAEQLQQGWRKQQAGDVASAEADYRAVLREQPNNANAWCYLGIACYDQNRLDEATAAYHRALELNPNFPIAHNNLGNALRRQGKLDEAIRELQLAVQQKPDYASAHHNLGIALLLAGRFQEGWPQYEWRRRCFGFQEPPYQQPVWDGSPLFGRTLLLHAEQGLGDTIQFIRYASAIPDGRIIVWCQRPLVPLLRTCPGIAHLMTHGDPLPSFDTHASLVSLPAILGTTETTIPSTVPYLAADPDLIAAWKRRLSEYPDLRVGIAWQGNPDHPADRDRSVPLECFAPLARVRGVTLFSLQKGPGREQIETAAAQVPLVDLGPRLDERTGPFLDTAAVMRELDLIITSDTSIAHLAGSLGVPVWVALSAAPDWRWMLDRDDSPWYPTMRLFRQRSLGNWSDVFERLASELAERVEDGSRGDIASPRSTSALSGPVPSSPAMRQIGLESSVPSQGPSIPMPTVAEVLAQAWQTHQSGNVAAAEQIYRQVVEAQPGNANAWCYLGIACHDLDKFNDAETAYREALRLNEPFPVAWNNLGNTLRRLERIDEALQCFRRAIELKPDYVNAFKNAGTTLVWEGRLDEAADWYRDALRLNPNDAESHRNVGIIRLLQGDFDAGWPEYEWRWHAGDLKRPEHAQPMWNGESVEGRTVLLYAEQGLGDTLHFVRYANVLKQRGATTVVQVQPPLVPILRGAPGIDTLISQRDTPPAFDVHASLLSVPAILKTDLASIPADVPYIFADPRLVEFWRSELAPFPGFRVGIVWQGNPDHQADHLRSVALTEFAPLANVPGVRLFSLQKGHGVEQLTGAGADLPVVDLGTRLDESSGAFLDTAAVMRNLDLVVTSDTSVAHLAGALGVPTWLALTYVPDWRWLLDREDSPWYPTMRLFRQTKPGDWTTVFERIATEVRTLVENQSAAEAAVEPAGELAASASQSHDVDEPTAVAPATGEEPTASAAAESGMLARHTTLAGFNDLVRARHGVILYNRHDIYIGRSLKLYGEFSEGEVELFRRLLRPGGVVVEAGANIGVHTLPLSRLVGKKGTVLAFEPQRIMFQLLCANMALNSVLNVHCHQQALGDVMARVMIPTLDYTRPNNFGGLGLGKYEQGEPVPLVTIDALSLSRCDLLKIDVEGMEQQVIRGAWQTIQRHRPLLYVENDRPAQSPALIELIRSLGYRLYWHTPPLFNPRNYFGTAENVFDDVVSINMLGVHQSEPDEFPDLSPVE